MKLKNLLPILFALILVISGSIYCEAQSAKSKDGFVSLFNGKNLDGWYLKIKSNDAELAKKVYAIEDGMVHVFNDDFPDTITLKTGENATHGLFYTNKKYSKFILRFEYKWGSKTFIPNLMGNEPSSIPQAELWIGVHPKAPSKFSLRLKLFSMVFRTSDQPRSSSSMGPTSSMITTSGTFARHALIHSLPSLNASGLNQKRL
jgi:hypothetical protein